MESDEYRKLAEVEDRMWYFRALHFQIEQALVATLGRGTAAVRILDVGCGTGGLIRRLAPRHPAWQWTGIDVSPIACGAARTRTGVEVVEGRVERLPFAGATWDAAVAADVLYHVEDDTAALREIFRVLRPGGVLVANEPACPWLWSYHDEAVHARRRYLRRILRDRAVAAGFADPWTSYRNAAALPFMALRRKLLPRPRAGSDVRMGPPAVEGAFRLLTASERIWLGRGGRLPWGSSVFLVARKPGGPEGLGE
jgi:ubiquinone/menaquinone biosynthesis C-methylase UbiE